MDRCATCPAAGECRAATLGVRRLCELADPTHPDHRPPYRVMLAGEVVVPASPWARPDPISRSPGAEIETPVAGAPTQNVAPAGLVPCGGCGETPAPATLGQMARGVLGAAVGFVASGGATVPGEVYQARMSTCRACKPHFEADWCLLCGCYLPAKTRLPDQECPIRKWLAVADQSVK